MGQRDCRGGSVLKVFILTLVCLNLVTFAAADMSLARVSMPALRPIELRVLRSQIEDTQGKRKLTESETKYKNLIQLADILKVKVVYQQHQMTEIPDAAAVTKAIRSKIQEDPSWKHKLENAYITELRPTFESLKSSFGEKSYEWAWVLRQNGELSASKGILMDLFNEGLGDVRQLENLPFGENPLVKMEFIHKALLPMSTVGEQKTLNTKMQEVKSKVSNLPDSMMMT